MNSNTQSLTQSLGANPRFCTPFDGSWLASREAIEKAFAVKAEHRQMVQAELARMRHTHQS
jgi:hypothetical protein